MSSVALSLPLEIEERLVATAVAHGHAVLAQLLGGIRRQFLDARLADAITHAHQILARAV